MGRVFEFDELADADLIVDAIYRGGTTMSLEDLMARVSFGALRLAGCSHTQRVD